MLDFMIIWLHVPHSDLFDEARAWDIWWYLTKDAAYQECAARVLRLKGWYNSPRP